MTDDLQSIEQQIAELQKRKKLLLDGQRADVLRDVRNNIRLFGFAASELGLSTGSRSVAPQKSEAKYANPENTSQTWHGGKGPKPKWIKAFFDKGGKLEDILINR